MSPSQRFWRFLKSSLKLAKPGDRCPRCEEGILEIETSRKFLRTLNRYSSEEASYSVSYQGTLVDEYLIIDQVKCPKCDYVGARTKQRKIED